MRRTRTRTARPARSGRAAVSLVALGALAALVALGTLLALALRPGGGPAGAAPATRPVVGAPATPRAGAAVPAYLIGAARVGPAVVVVESAGVPAPVDVVLTAALRRPADDPVLQDLDWTRLRGGSPPRRTPLPPEPLVDCVAVSPWSGASAFLGVRFAIPGGSRSVVNQFVLRYPDVRRAEEQMARLRHQIDDCPALAPGWSGAAGAPEADEVLLAGLVAGHLVAQG